MAFKKMDKPTYPIRQWALVGFPGAGKSTFCAQMPGPILVIDADHRFDEVLHLANQAGSEVYRLSDNPADSNSTDTIARILETNMPDSGIQTIVVDSLTAILTPLKAQATRDNAAGINTNKASAFIDKSTAQKQIQHAVSRWGVHCVWCYHKEKGRDNKGQEETRTTLTKTERDRFHSSLNAELHVIDDKGRRGIQIVWSRSGRDGITLWDASGHWEQFPDRIEAAMFDADFDPAGFMPCKKEFFAKVGQPIDKGGLGLKAAEAAEKLKAAQFNGYDWRKAGAMWEALKRS